MRRAGREGMMLPLSLLLFSLFVQVAYSAEATDATKSTVTVTDGLEFASAGKAATFTVTARDESGAARTSGGDNFIVELEGTRSIGGSVLDKLDGKYQVTYTATKSGSYEAAVKLATSGGLSASYFENVWFFYTPVKVTVDPQINLDWGTGALTTTGSDYISVRWVGKLKTQYAEVYTFYATTDDGARLWVDNVPLIDRWDSFCNETAATIALKANVFYPLKMEYKEVTGTAFAKLSWASQSTPKEIIPSSQLYYETHVKQSPFSLVVSPDVACGSRSTGTGTGLATATAGTAAQLTIQANDAFDNERGVGGDKFAVRVFPPDGGTPVHAVVVDNSDSSYSVEFTAFKSGTNPLYATLLEAAGLIATYYHTPGIDTSVWTPVFTTAAAETDGRVTFNTGAGAIRSGVNNYFAGRWTGFVQPPSDNEYTFQTSVGRIEERVRMWVDNSLLINQWSSMSATAPTGTMQLRKDVYYDVKIEYTSWAAVGTSARALNFYWAHPASTTLGQVASMYLFAGHEIKDSPFNVDVKPAGTSAAKSTASDGYGTLSISTAGLQSEFTITARDLYGNDRKIGGENFKVRLTGADSGSGLVQDMGNGDYKVFYTATKSGVYDASIVFGANGIKNSPYRLVVQPARRHIPSSPVTGMGLTLCTAGVISSVTVTVKDRHDNLQPAADWDDPNTSAKLVFSLLNGPTPVTDVVAVGDSPKGLTTSTGANLVMRYTATVTGSYQLALKATTLHDGAVKGSPFALTVYPHLPCATTSTASSSSLSLVTAGVRATFTIQARDMYKNLRGSHIGDRMVARVRQMTQSTTNTKKDRLATVVDNKDSTYSLSFDATRSPSNVLWAQLASMGTLMSTYYTNDGITTTPVAVTGVSSDEGSDWSRTNARFGAVDNWSARFSGLVRPSLAQQYTFVFTVKHASERLRMWVDNIMVVDQWTSLAALTGDSSTVAFPVANGYYDLFYEYGTIDTTSSAARGVKLQWKSSGTVSHTISSKIESSRLFAAFHVSGSPFTVLTKPAVPCATLSTSSLASISLATAGIEATFTVQSKDAFSNLRESSGDPWDFAVLSGSSLYTNLASVTSEPSVNDGGTLAYQGTTSYLSSGGYKITYTGTTQGVYELRGKLRASGGLYGTYFENQDLTDHGQGVGVAQSTTALPFQRFDNGIDFAWGTSVPVASTEMSTAKSIGPDFFSVRWHGMIMPAYSETWTFHTEVDDGVKLWVNDLLIIDQWATADAASTSTSSLRYSRCSEVDGTIALMKDVLYNIRLEYKEMMGNATIRLRWSSKSQPKEIVPSARLYVDTTSKQLSRDGLPLLIMPAVTCASKSSASGPGLTIATAGAASVFTIQSRDQYNNKRRLGDMPLFNVRVVPAISGQQLPLPPDSVTRLPGLYPGGLTATYYDGDLAAATRPPARKATCVGEPWSTESGADVCGTGPWGTFAFTAGANTNKPAFYTEAPNHGATTQTWGVRWSGYIKPTAAAVYTFEYTLGGGSTEQATITINNVARTGLATGVTTQAVTFATAEEMYNIDIDYFATGTVANTFAIKWAYEGSSTFSAIPTTRLFPLAGRYKVQYTPTIKGDYSVNVVVAHPGGLDATYYDDEMLTVPRYSRVDAKVAMDISTDADFSTSARTTGLVALSDVQSFGVRWAGLVYPLASPAPTAPTTLYTFQVNLQGTVANGQNDGRVKLWVDNSLIIDRWDTYDDVVATSFSATINLKYSASQHLYTDIKLEYKQYAGPSGKCTLQWATGASGMIDITSSNLFQAAHIAGSPFPPHVVQPAVTCAALSTVRGIALSVASAGVQGSFTIQAHDRYNNERGVGGDIFHARLFPVSGSCTGCPNIVRGSVTDNTDSSYTGVFNGTKGGTYKVWSSLAEVGGLVATYYDGSEFGATLRRGTGLYALDWSSATYPSGWGVTAVPYSAKWLGFVKPSYSGDYTFKFTLQSETEQRIKLWVDNTAILTQWTSLGSLTPTAKFTAVANNLYDIQFNYLTKATTGNNGVTMKWSGPGVSEQLVATTRIFARHDVADEIAAATVMLPDGTDAGACIASGNGLSMATSGTIASFTITSKDSFANVRTVDTDNYAVRLEMDGVALINTKPVYMSGNPGAYQVTYTPTLSGSYAVSVSRPVMGGLKGEYFNNMWLLGDPADTNVDSTINFDWSSSAVTPRAAGEKVLTGSDYVSVRWSGFFKPTLTEVYTFHTLCDDGVRLWVDNVLRVDKWENTADFGVEHTATVSTEAGKLYDIKMEYKEVTSTAYAKLYYSTQSIARRVVPSSRLFHTPVHIFGSPFRLYVDPTATCATKSTVMGPGLSYATSGHTASFTVQAKDKYSNTKTQWATTEDYFVVRATPSTLTKIKYGTVKNNVVKGKYNVAYRPTLCGSTSIITTLAVQGGLTATYYTPPTASPAFSGTGVTGRLVIQEKIDFSVLGAGAGSKCDSTVCGTFFNVRWEGFIRPADATLHTYTMQINDVTERVRVWLDNSLVINQWTSLSTATPAYLAQFQANEMYDLKIEFWESAQPPSVTAGMKAKLQWKNAALGTDTVIPTDRLFAIGSHVGSSPYTVTVAPDVTHWASSKFLGKHLTLATAGLVHTVSIQSKDAAGNNRNSGGDSYVFHAAQDPTSTANGAVFDGTITDGGDGRYTVKYTPTAQGAYNVRAYMGTQDQTFTLMVEPGASCASTTVAHSVYLSIATAGLEASFTIQAKDAFKNIRTIGADNYFLARLTGPNGEEHNRPVVYPNLATPQALAKLGTFETNYRTTGSGQFKLSVMMFPDGVSGLTGVYYRDAVQGNAVRTQQDYAISSTSASSCCNWGASTPHDDVGIVDGFSVQWNGYIKSVSKGEYTFSLAVAEADERVRLWVDDQYLINQWTSLSSITPTGSIGLLGGTLYDIKIDYKDITGDAKLEMSWTHAGGSAVVPSTNLFSNPAHISGSPFTVTVFPHVACGAVSSATGNGLSLATAGIAASFTIQAKDELGNARTNSDDFYVVRARHTGKYTMIDLHGTVTSLAGNKGQYSVLYIPQLKQNAAPTDGGPWHDVLTSLAVPTSTGIMATYYTDMDYSTTNTQSAGQSVVANNLDWSAAAGAAVASVKYGIRWAGFVRPSEASPISYTFNIDRVLSAGHTVGETINERFRLWIDNKLIIDDWTSLSSSGALSGTFSFPVANHFYDLKMDYYNLGTAGAAQMSGAAKVTWQSTATTPAWAVAAITTARLFQRSDLSFHTWAAGGLAATYYTSSTVGSAYVKITTDQTVDWSGPGTSETDRPYAVNVANGDFSARWLGFVKPSRRDLYTFYTGVSVNTERVKLWVDNSLIVSAWTSLSSLEPTGTMYFPKAETYYQIEMHYKSVGTSAATRKFQLKWQNMGLWKKPYNGPLPTASETVAKAIIPSTRLFQQRSNTAVTRDDSAHWFPAAWPCAGTWNNMECKGSGTRATEPVKVQVNPAESCSSTTTAAGVRLTVVTAGMSSTYSVTVRDQFSNIRDSTTDALMGRAAHDVDTTSVFHSAFTSTTAADMKNPLGYYTGTYLITRSGTYQMEVALTDKSGNGLYGTYFSKADLSGSVVNKYDTTVDFDWGKGAPTADSAIGSDNFSVRWTGNVKPTYTEVYTFYTRTDDGVKLWVSGTQLIDAWSTTGTEQQGTIQLTANVQYDIKMEYKEVTDSAFAELRWQSPSTAKAIIPSTALYPSKRTILNGLTALTVYEDVICGTSSTVTGSALTLVTAGIAATFTIQAKDQYGNKRTKNNPSGSEYQVKARIIPDDAATNLNALTSHTPSVDYTVAPVANSGTHVVSFTVTRSGTHNLFASVAIGAFPGPSTYGLQATYYDQSTFLSPAFATTAATVDFSAPASPGASGPGSLADDGVFSVRWAGLVLASNTAAKYTYTTILSTNDERVRLWVDNQLIVNQWSSLSATNPSGTVASVVAGRMYDIAIDYKATVDSTSAMQLKWDPGTTASAIVPSTSLYQAHTVSGEPKRIKVNPAVACATVSTVYGAGLTLATAGVQARFWIQCNDAYLNKRGKGSDIHVVRAFPRGQTGDDYTLDMQQPHDVTGVTAAVCLNCPRIVHGAVVDNGDSSYTATYTPTKSGYYVVVSSLLTQGGLLATYWNDHTTDSGNRAAGVGATSGLESSTQALDFSYTAAPGALSNIQYAARWQGFVRPSKASQYTFFTTLNNVAERVKLWVDNSLVINQWTSLAVAEPSGTISFGTANGYYDITVAYKQSANVAAVTQSAITLKWQNTISGSASQDVAKSRIRSDRLYKRWDVTVTGALGVSNIQTMPAGGCASQSIAYLMATSLATAGVAATFTIQSKDAYANPRAVNTDMTFQVDLYGSGGSPVTFGTPAAGALPNFYSASYTANTAKNYELFVKYNNDNVMASPFTLTVRPNVICGAKSTATGTGLSAAAASSTQAFTIQARDHFSNAKTQNGEGALNTFSVRVVRTAAQGAWPHRYDPGGGASTGVTRASATIHGVQGTATNDGKYAYTWTMDTATSDSNYVHASWATSGGLWATYYARTTGNTMWNLETEFANRRFVKIATTINYANAAANANFFDYTQTIGAATCLSTADKSLAVRWAGFYKPSSTSAWSFALQATAQTTHKNERVKLWVDNSLLIRSWSSIITSASGLYTGSTAINLVAGTLYDIVIEYSYDDTTITTSARTLQLQEACCAAALTTVPSTKLFWREDVAGSPWLVTISA